MANTACTGTRRLDTRRQYEWPGTAPSREELLEFMSSRVAKWWLPDDVTFVDELPHTATGKLLKTKLREQFKHHTLPA